jgi:hypothetical protein
MSETILSAREEALFAAQFGAAGQTFGDREFLVEFTAPFVDALPWRMLVDRVHPLFPERIRNQFFERRVFNRAERALQKFGGRFGVALRPHGSYGWRHLIARLESTEVAPFTRALLSVLQELGFQDLQRRIVDTWIERSYGEFIAAVNRRENGSNTVVFITSRTDYKPLREAISLRPLGWRCFLICLEPLPEIVRPMFEGAFEQILSIPLQPALLEMLVARMQPNVFHVHCAMWHYHLGKITIDNKGSAVCACEFNDITSFYADRKVMSDYWSTDLIDRDWAMERYICNKADVLIHQWNPGMEAHWRAVHGGVQRVIEMQPYPVKQWIRYAENRPSQNDGIIRLVWAGQIPGRIACPPVVFDAYYLGEAIEKLLRQGFLVDTYQNPMFTANFADPNFEFYRDLNQRFPKHFAIKPGVRLDRLAETLSNYDFGLCLFDVPFHRACTPPAKTKYMMTNKLSTYFEAGIPIIVNWEYESMADFVTENGFGIALRSDEVERAIEYVRRFDRDAAVERIKRYNRDHLMQVEIRRLLAAYEDAARGVQM